MGTSIAELTRIIARTTGISLVHVKQVARRLLEADMLPRSTGSYVATASNVDVVVLLLGALARTPIHAVPSVARTLFDLRDPTTVQTLGSRLAELLMTIRTLDVGADVALDGEIVIDANTPLARIALNLAGERIESTFASISAKPLTADEVRQLVVIPTSVLGKIALALGRKADVAA